MREDELEMIRIIGLNVLIFRRSKNISQDDLAKEAGISRSRLSELENGKGNFNISSLVAISKALEIELCDLVRNDRKIMTEKFADLIANKVIAKLRQDND